MLQPVCPSCNQPVPLGVRWCPICRVNVINPQLGKLASPGRRFGAYLLDTLVPLFVFWISLVLLLFELKVTAFVCWAILSIHVGWNVALFFSGTTPAKHLLGMYVVKEDGTRAGFWTMLCRELISKVVSWLPPTMLIGGFMIEVFSSLVYGYEFKASDSGLKLYQVISWLVFGLWYLGILVDKERQALHDKIVSTYVVEKTST